MSQLAKHGYTLTGYFVLPNRSWEKEYYIPLGNSFDAFLNRHSHSAEAKQTVAAYQKEIALYRAYQMFYSYGFYVAKKDT